jgi:lysophospholipase L1-like esterase
VIPLAPVPGAALGRDGDYFKTRLAEARAPQVSKEIAAALELLHLPVPTRVQAPDWMLVMLGTNDIRVDEAWSLLDESTELDAAVDRLMLQVPAGTRVLWVVPVAAALRADRRAEFAAGLERAMSRWPALELLHRELAQAIRAATRTAEGGE